MESQKKNRQFSVALTSFAVSGLLAIVLLASFGGDWGTAYGQTAGPTPTNTTEAGAPTPTPVIVITDPAVAKFADPLSAVNGETVRFTITVTNPGSIPMTDINVVDNVPDIFRVDNVTTTKGTVSTSNQTVTVTIDRLDPGEVVTIVVTTTVQTTTNATLNMTNTVVVNGNSGGNPFNKTGVAGVTINGSAPNESSPVAGPIIPGVPRTGHGFSEAATASQFEVWKIVALVALALILLGSLSVMLRIKFSKK